MTNLAACPAVPEVGCTAPPNVANGGCTLPSSFQWGERQVVVWLYFPPPAANNLLLAHPGPAGAANTNNLAASRQNQQRVANAVVAGVGGVIYIDEVDAESMRHPRNRNNIKALDGASIMPCFRPRT